MDPKVVSKIGKYEIVAELGQGGMGVVYKARDLILERLVALKTVTPELVSNPEILKRFYREAKSAGALQHPNIVTIYDLGAADGRPYIAMEFVEGESLQDIISRRAKIPLAAKLKLVQQVCEGLSYAHKQGLVHRDVKPANILVTNDGNVKVVDFGLVHWESTNLTQAGAFLGTIHYASPEQINDERVDSRSDLWSLACVLYELIAYKKAFDGSNIADIVAAVLGAEPEPLSRCCPGVPADLDTVISQGLKKKIDERYQSLDELLGDLLPIARSLQLSFIGDMLLEAKALREQGDFNAAREKARAVLILDNSHADARRLHNELNAELQRLAPAAKAKKLVAEAEQATSRQDRVSREGDLRLKEALQQTDNRVSAGEYEDAQKRLLELQQEFPTSDEVHLKLKILEPLVRARKLVQEAKHALEQGEYAEAARAFTESLNLDPEDHEARELKDRAIKERDRLRQVREALSLGQRAMRQGDASTAEQEIQRALQLDPANSQAVSLWEQFRQAQTAREREARFRETLQKSGDLVAEGKIADAQDALRQLQEEFPDSAEIEQKLLELDQPMKVAQLIQESQLAFNQGEFGEAVRILTEAQGLDPGDARVRDLKVRAVQERDRLRQVREAISAGQRAMRQGHPDVADREFQRALQLDPASAQATSLLAQIQKDRQGREREQRLKEGLSRVEILLSGEKFDEAHRQLTELEQAYPDAEVVQQKLQALKERKAEPQAPEARR
jgi:serine/threonine-protein kinase